MTLPVPSGAASTAATSQSTATTKPGAAREETRLRETATAFEAAFLAEMLTHAGLDKALTGETGFGGQAFARHLIDAYATQMTKNGGIGLAEDLYRAMKAKLG